MLVRRYDPLDRPPCWVHDEDRWYLGRVHSWHRTEAGWTAVATWHVGVGLQKYQDVPAGRLKDGTLPDPNVEETGDVAAPWLLTDTS